VRVPPLFKGTPRAVPDNHLLHDFSAVEVRKALDSIGDLKAPGPDGTLSLFYKKFWDIVGEQVTSEVLGVLNGGPFPQGWNETTIVLIPKVSTPLSIKDLRPISLCNVLYKLVSKVLANRLKNILPEVISSTQSAFVPGRLITDNILIAYELTHYLKRKQKGKTGYAAIKLDMSKAYDRVEWCFLQDMMRKLGFHPRWIDLIMKCVSSLSYRIKVNRVLTEPFLPERGLQQGDPLSPYLFLLCAEGFSVLLKKAEEEGNLKGVRVCPGAPAVSHLLIADDSLILCRADGRDAKQLRRILHAYQECSGQTINKQKSAIMFSANTRETKKGEVMQILEIQKETMNERYLGMPVYVGKSKKNVFLYLKERIWQHVQGWKEKMLSKAGKEVLIKVVAQAIPTYVMGCFDITKEVCDQISSLIARYWWNNQDKDNKIHWLSKEVLTRPKSEGGLGFRDIHTFNLAMLSKQVWRLIQNPDSLCAKILGAKYFPHGDVLNPKHV
jgi:hypothetical protein